MITVRLFVFHPMARACYRDRLAREADFRLIEQERTADVGVIDSGLDPPDRTLSAAWREAPGTKLFLVVPRYDDTPCLRWLVQGVRGVLSHAECEQHLACAIRHIASGQLWLPAALALKWILHEAGARDGLDRLRFSRREREVMKLVAAGLSNKEIASAFGISERAVKWHVTNLLAKAKLHSRRELAALVPAA